jgi:hypothetical protein
MNTSKLKRSHFLLVAGFSRSKQTPIQEEAFLSLNEQQTDWPYRHTWKDHPGKASTWYYQTKDYRLEEM